MSANKEENEETFHQLESRLQKLESQRRLEEYGRREKKRTERKASAYTAIFAALTLLLFGSIGCIASHMLDNPDGTSFLTLLFLGICILFLLIAGLRQLNE